MTRPLVVATTPIWEEPDELVERARSSVERVGIEWHGYAGGIARLVVGGRFVSESSMRDHGRELAARAGARWWLQLDADEYLRNGAALLEELERCELRLFPLLYSQPTGLFLAPFKLAAMPATFRVVSGCDHFRWAGDDTVWRCSGYPVADRSLMPSRAVPWLEHDPAGRGGGARARARLSEWEGVLERPPSDAVQYPASIGKREAFSMTDSTPEVNEAGEVTDEREYYCPACGRRFSVAGDCTGHPEAPHEAIGVEKVADAAAAPAADETQPAEAPGA